MPSHSMISEILYKPKPSHKRPFLVDEVNLILNSWCATLEISYRRTLCHRRPLHSKISEVLHEHHEFTTIPLSQLNY